MTNETLPDHFLNVRFTPDYETGVFGREIKRVNAFSAGILVKSSVKFDWRELRSRCSSSKSRKDGSRLLIADETSE